MPIAATGTVSAFERDWQDLCTFLTKWYYKPDLEGLRIVLCCYLSHFYLTSPPVWLSIIGLPGSGKTELGIRPLETLGPNVQSISKLTTACFLSGFGEGNGILDKLLPISRDSPSSEGIWLFPDLTTTLLSRDPLSRTEIMGILRRIYDGAFETDVGNKAKKLTWAGKVTAIAACTPDIEDHWAMHRDMGERWLNIKWGNLKPSFEDMLEISSYAREQEGNEDKIRKEVRARIKNLIDNAGNGPDGQPKQTQIDAVGILLEQSRMNIKRDFHGKVQDRGNIQFNSRTSKSLGMICKASACLRRDDKFTEEDFNLAKRVALDSIPSKRYSLMRKMIDLYPGSVTKNELTLNLDFPRGSFDKVLEELRYLKIIEIEDMPDDDLGQEEGLTKGTYDYKTPNRRAEIRLTADTIRVMQYVGLIQK